jgi:hypothetical protein
MYFHRKELRLQSMGLVVLEEINISVTGNVVVATVLLGILVGRGIVCVCPKDEVCVVVVVLDNGSDRLTGASRRSTVKPTQRGGYRTFLTT